MDQMKLGKSFPAPENAEIGEGVSSMWESGAARLGFDTTGDLSWSFLAVGCLVSLWYPGAAMSKLWHSQALQPESGKLVKGFRQQNHPK